MPQDRSARQVLVVTITEKWPRGRPRSMWRDYISDLAWSRLGVQPAELSEIHENCEVFRVLVLLPSFTDPPERKSGFWKCMTQAFWFADTRKPSNWEAQSGHSTAGLIATQLLRFLSQTDSMDFIVFLLCRKLYDCWQQVELYKLRRKQSAFLFALKEKLWDFSQSEYCICLSIAKRPRQSPSYRWPMNLYMLLYVYLSHNPMTHDKRRLADCADKRAKSAIAVLVVSW